MQSDMQQRDMRHYLNGGGVAMVGAAIGAAIFFGLGLHFPQMTLTELMLIAVPALTGLVGGSALLAMLLHYRIWMRRESRLQAGI